MYASFFGLKRTPFSIAPDPRYLFMSERHREALAHLLYGLNAGGGVVLLTGEIGAGKTTVCRCFLEQIPKRCNVAYIFNPKLTVDELLKSICDEFGVPYGPADAARPAFDGRPPTVKDYLDPLNEFLLKTHAVGQNNVLIIDEAQNLSADVLEQLRLLTNLETSERKLLQIVLIGQPELRDKLAQPGLEQLAQRVVARFHLDALSHSETAQYIAHRLSVAGMTAANPFDAAAVKHIHRLTGGVPRRINLLCDRALLGAYASASPRVDRHIVDTAAVEVFGAARRSATGGEAVRVRWVAAWSVAGGLLAGAALVGLALSARQEPAAAAASLHSGAAGKPGSATPSVGSAALAGLNRNAGATAVASGTARSIGPSAFAAAGSSGMPTSPTATSAAAGASPTGLAGAVAGNGGPMPGERLPVAASIDTAALFALLPRSEADAWRALAPLWPLALGDGEPCQAASRLQAPCFRGNVDPALIRRLDRPGILTLRDDGGRTAYALLVGLSGTTALLRLPASGSVDTGVRSVPLVALARLWRGDFATFWRAPPGYAGNLANGSAGPAVDWLAMRLAGLLRESAPARAQTFDESLRARLVAFQLANELRPDGIAGPTTFMLINRASGVDEPRLLPAAATPAS